MTVEEKAERYIKNGWGELNVGGWRARMKESFVAGHKEAMRWRDPKIELPEYYKKVEIKIKRDDVVDYVNASLLAEDDGSLFFGDYNFMIFIKLKDVIGWRPIE